MHGLKKSGTPFVGEYVQESLS